MTAPAVRMVFEVNPKWWSAWLSALLDVAATYAGRMAVEFRCPMCGEVGRLQAASGAGVDGDLVVTVPPDHVQRAWSMDVGRPGGSGTATTFGACRPAVAGTELFNSCPLLINPAA